MRFWPKTLARQMILLLVLALIAAQIGALLIFAGERRETVISVNRGQLITRTVSLVNLLASTPPELHRHITETLSTRGFATSIATAPAVDPGIGANRENFIQKRIAKRLEDTGARPVLVDLREIDLFYRRNRDDDDDDRRERLIKNTHPHKWPSDRLSLMVAIGLPDGHWLNIEHRLEPPPPLPGYLPLTYLSLAVLGVVLVTVFMVRRITRPLEALGVAAEKLGRGESAEPLGEGGPLELQRTARAFNAMQERIARYVKDRTRMLAAISHDLRTPITSLRLRAEFVEDEEQRGKILETLDEMATLTEVTLAFAPRMPPTNRRDRWTWRR